jgi:hypothetical protein
MPRTVEILFSPPPALARLRQQEYVRLVEDKVAAVQVDRRQEGTHVLGPHRILAQRWDARPSDAEPRRELSPAVACRDKWRRIERLLMNKLFLEVYRAAFLALPRRPRCSLPFRDLADAIPRKASSQQHRLTATLLHTLHLARKPDRLPDGEWPVV